MINDLTSDKKKQDLKIVAYGFDVSGFALPTEPVTLNDIGIIEFVEFKDPINLENADGVIIPQGIFEKFSIHPGFYGDFIKVEVEYDLLLERERQIVNLLENNRWICFLVEEIKDKVGDRNAKDTDLCKRILNKFNIERKNVVGISEVQAKTDEFSIYIRNYGVAKTVFRLPYSIEKNADLLATAEDNTVGFEIENKIFFLPVHTTKRDEATCIQLNKLLINALLDYRQKRSSEIPQWLNEFQFETEKEIQVQLDSLSKQFTKLENSLNKWDSYKLILTTSGGILKNLIVDILENYFSLRVDSLDVNIEDAKILDKDGTVLTMIEIKGTKKGIKREHINQVDSHRERNGLKSETPGVLIINNEMSTVGVKERMGTDVPTDQIKHANNLNILILRTIDLLLLIRQFEKVTNRGEQLLSLLGSGGGWLRVDLESYKLLTE